MSTDIWEPGFIEGDCENAIVGHYGADEDGEPFIIVGSIREAPASGYVWDIEDNNVGPINQGWEPSKDEAIAATFAAANEWMEDDSVSPAMLAQRTDPPAADEDGHWSDSLD